MSFLSRNDCILQSYPYTFNICGDLSRIFLMFKSLYISYNLVKSLVRKHWLKFIATLSQKDIIEIEFMKGWPVILFISFGLSREFDVVMLKVLLCQCLSFQAIVRLRAHKMRLLFPRKDLLSFDTLVGKGSLFSQILFP